MWMFPTATHKMSQQQFQRQWPQHLTEHRAISICCYKTHRRQRRNIAPDVLLSRCCIQSPSVHEDKHKVKKIKKSIPDPQTLLRFQCCCQATLHYLKSNLPFLHLKHDEEQSDFDGRQEVFLTVRRKQQSELIKAPPVWCSSHARSAPEEHACMFLYVIVS